MHTAEMQPDGAPRSSDGDAAWAVRVLLAAALSRALRAGLSKDDICALLRELESEGESDA